jgi:glycosyltransferase involved in cell wall biosynthesis
MHIWIINPFDQLPNETDVPLRYWALSRTFAEQGHEVIWWSSDFSHLTKSKRSACPDTDGFAVRLIETPPYTKNISLARLKNHKAFADGFYRDAMAGLESGELKAPDRIVVSLPPLGVAEQAFRIRDALRKCKSKFQGAERRQDRTRSGPDQVGTYEGQRDDPEPSHINTFSPSNPSNAGTPSNPSKAGSPTDPADSHQSSTISHQSSQPSCQVIVDIMDAWPETFYQALPKPLRKTLGPVLLAQLHRSAKRAYRGADKISAVGQSYLDLASRYLGKKWKVEKSESGKGENQRSDQSSPISHQSSLPEADQAKPVHLCYHGTDLSRFRRDKSEGEAVKSESKNQHEGRDACPQASSLKTSAINVPSAPKGHPLQSPSASLRANRSDLPSSHSRASSSIIQDQSSLPKADHQPSTVQPLKAVYLGAMGSGYDLQTIIEVAARWKTETIFPFQIHFAGDGPQREALEARATQLGLTSPHSSVINHQSSKQPSHSSNALLCPWVQPPTASSARVVFHGHLGKTPITVLLESSDLALVPNRPGSLVACPYKAGEYAAAGLPMVSCLGGELGDLLKTWNAGSEYNEGDVDSLDTAFKKYSTDVDLLKKQSLNAGKMAEALFDRERTYPELAEFILH